MTEDDERDVGEKDDDEDPFEWMRTESDREGDPFDHLPGPDERDAARTDDDPSERDGDVLQPSDVVGPGDLSDDGGLSDDGDRSNGDHAPGAEREVGSANAGGSPHTPTADPSDHDAPTTGPRDGLDGDDPFGDVATPEGDPFEGDAGGVFERVDVDRVDPDEVWNEVAGDESDGDAGADEAPELTAAESRYAEVSKHSYCEQCEHFSAPPNVACANPGTEIVEFVDVETVRLLNCPVVAERAELEDEG